MPELCSRSLFLGCRVFSVELPSLLCSTVCLAEGINLNSVFSETHPGHPNYWDPVLFLHDCGRCCYLLPSFVTDPQLLFRAVICPAKHLQGVQGAEAWYCRQEAVEGFWEMAAFSMKSPVLHSRLPSYSLWNADARLRTHENQTHRLVVVEQEEEEGKSICPIPCLCFNLRLPTKCYMVEKEPHLFKPLSLGDSICGQT